MAFTRRLPPHDGPARMHWSIPPVRPATTSGKHNLWRVLSTTVSVAGVCDPSGPVGATCGRQEVRRIHSGLDQVSNFPPYISRKRRNAVIMPWLEPSMPRLYTRYSLIHSGTPVVNRRRNKTKWAFCCRPTVLTLGMVATQRTEGFFGVAKRSGVDKKLSLCALWDRLQRLSKMIAIETAR